MPFVLLLERLFSCSGDVIGFTVEVVQGKLLSVGNLVRVRHTLCLTVTAGSSPYIPACISQATASHPALFCFPKADERGKDVAWGHWGRMWSGGCAAVLGIGGLEEDTGGIAGDVEHHWDPQTDWEGAGQEDL